MNCFDGHCLYEVQLVEGVKKWVLIYAECPEGCGCREFLFSPDPEYEPIGVQIDGSCSEIVTPKE